MATIAEKKRVLLRVAGELNRHHILWALGASAMLWLKGIRQDFHDLDLFILERDVPLVRRILGRMGELQRSEENPQYQTRCFLEYTVDGVDLDIMAGFTIVDGVTVYDCSLEPDQIRERILLEGETIPIQSPELWEVYYRRMHREDRAEEIHNWLAG